MFNRGYYIRAKTIDYILRKFLDSNDGEKQIISLGAGFDSAYFRLKSQNLIESTVFYEVRFAIFCVTYCDYFVQKNHSTPH